jgi:Ser/Thr protein kinase RdoA (MazF antagonist)
MEKHIKESMNQVFQNQALALYGLKKKNLEDLEGYENFVYGYEDKGKDYVLRFVHSDHRTYEEVLAEIEYIDYLAHHGASVSQVILSQDGNIVKKLKIDDASYFSVCVFTKGKGKQVQEEIEDPSYWQRLGKEVGRMHVLTKTYEPIHRRKEWDEDMLYTLADKVLVGKYAPIKEELEVLKKAINELAKNKDNYGLIHTDLHRGNMVLDQGKNFTFFDFDDSAYKHFIADMAIILYYEFAFKKKRSKEERTSRSIWMMEHFIKGYQEENKLSKEDWSHLNTFLRLREFELMIVVLSEGQETVESEWGRKFLEGQSNIILKHKEFLDLERFLKELHLF